VPKPAPPPLVKVRVMSTPPGASVREDGVELCVTTPCDVAYEASSELHNLVVSKPGFASKTITTRATDGQVEARLPALSSDPKTGRKAPVAPPEGFKDLPY